MSNVPFAAQMEELAAYMASKISVPTIGIGGGYAPIGTINFFDATTAPQDWLACDGSVHNIADYPQLAEWYATQHGVANFYGGNGTTTFAVPNLQGEFLRGTGTNSHSGQGSGASVGTHQDGTIFAGSLSDTTALYNRGFGSSGLCNSVTNADSNVKRNIVQSASSASGEAISNIDCPTFRPTNTSFLICVKAVVAGEVYSTEEQVVGTWFDGSLLYRRCYELSASFIQSALNGDAIELTGIAKSTCAVKRYEYEIYRTNDYAVYRGDMNNFASSPSDSWSSYGSPSQGGSFSNWQFYLKLGSSYDGACKGGIVIVEYTKTT